MRIVIKSGKFEEKHEVTCDNCGCAFSFLYNDTYLSSYWRKYRAIECPECESEVNTDILKDD